MTIAAEPDESRLHALEKRTAIPMLIVSASLVPLLIIPLLVPLPENLTIIINQLDWIVWSIFTIEYTARLILARNRHRFVLHNLIDLATVILPLLPHLQITSSARTLRLLRVGRVLSVGLRSGKQSERVVNHRSVTIAATVAVTIIVSCAAFEYDVEHLVSGSNIKTVGDAFWWAIATVTSVGYGDKYPITTEGRLIAALLMVVGICTSGLIAAAFASTFIEQRNEEEFDPQLQALRTRLDSIDRILLLLETHSAVIEARSQDDGSKNPV